MAHVRSRLGVSERRACRVLGQVRASQRYRPRRAVEEPRLVQRMLALVAEHPRYGYRRMWALLRREGWRVNRKRIWRLWRREGLKVPQQTRRKRRLGNGANGCGRRRAAGKNDVWAWDFIHDRTTAGRSLKWLSVVDEYTRECLVLHVDRRLPATKVWEVLVELFKRRGLPRHLRSDNGPAFIAQFLRRRLKQLGVETWYVEPGSPWQNGYAESFHSRLRDEFLNREVFDDLATARVLGAAWREEYNQCRPHSALGYRTPAEFAAEGGKGCFATLSSHFHPPQEIASI